MTMEIVSVEELEEQREAIRNSMVNSDNAQLGTMREDEREQFKLDLLKRGDGRSHKQGVVFISEN
jgi:hypothetical protein